MQVHPLKDQPRILLYTSCLTSFSVYYSYINNYTLVCIATSSLLLTSINHWRKPEYSFRRKLDIFAILINFPIELICFRRSKKYKEYLGLIFLACLCYPISNRIKNKKICILFHSMIHIIANFANCLAMNN
jgi:hypothetical protein